MVRALLCVALWFNGLHAGNGSERVPDTVAVTATYAVEIDYPNFLVALGAKLFGAEPDTLRYQEVWTADTAGATLIRARMVADDDDIWFDLAADTLAQSFTDFPMEGVRALGLDGFRAVAALIAFLKNPGGRLFTGSFKSDSVLFLIRAFPDTRAAPPEDGEYVRLLAAERHVAVIVYNAEPPYTAYTSGMAAVGTIDGTAAYPFITAYFYDADITIRLFLRRFSVRRATPETPRQ